VVSTQGGDLYELPLSKLVLRPRQEFPLGWCHPVFYTDDETGIVAGNGNELSLLDSEHLKTVWRVEDSKDWLLSVVARPGEELYCIEWDPVSPGTWLKTRSLLDGSVRLKRLLNSNRILKTRVSAFQGRRAAVCDLEGESQLRILSLETEDSPYVGSLPVNSVAWECHPSDATIAIAERGMISLYDAMTGNIVWSSEEQTSNLEKLFWTPDGRLLVGALADRRVCVWNGETGELQATMGVTAAPGACWTFATDGETLLGVDREGTLSAWHPESGSKLFNLRSAVPIDPFGFDIDSRGRLLFSSSARPPVIRFD
jgi:WD40 repeat protein